MNIDQAFGKECALLYRISPMMQGELWSPLELAVDTGNGAMVKLLVDHQARVSKSFVPGYVQTCRFISYCVNIWIEYVKA